MDFLWTFCGLRSGFDSLCILESRALILPSPAGGIDGTPASFGTESASGRAWRELAGSLCAVASVSPGEGSRHRGNQHHHHHDYQGSSDEANDDGEEDYIAAAEAAIAALGSRVDSRCRSFRDCKPLLIHNSSGTSSREFRRAPVQVPWCFSFRPDT